MAEEKLASRWLVSTDCLASHLSDPNTSLVMHSEWIRMGTADCPPMSP